MCLSPSSSSPSPQQFLMLVETHITTNLFYSVWEIIAAIVRVCDMLSFPMLFLYPSLPDFDSATIPGTVVISTDSSMECSPS